jgi:hypothetical protein
MRNNNDNSEKLQPPKELIEIQAVAEPTRKQRGEAAEAQFIARATSLGFVVLKPWGDSARYDAAIDHGRGFWRVQVKLTTCLYRSQYRLRLKNSQGVTYTPAEIDFVAGCVGPLSLWYIVPIEVSQGRMSLHFSPHDHGTAKYEKYREAWCLLDCPPHARGRQDIPTVCRCPELAVRCAVCPLLERSCRTDTPVRRF